jgi:UDP-glucose 4-epimerase
MARHPPGYHVFNVGTGIGVSVFEMIRAFEKVPSLPLSLSPPSPSSVPDLSSQASGCRITYEVGPRRQGDVPIYYSDITKAKEVLGWEAKYTVDQACEDTWRWQSNNPNGYE